MLNCVSRSSIIFALCALSLACSPSSDPEGDTILGDGQQMGILIPMAITTAALDECTKTAFFTVDNKEPAIQMELTDVLASITIPGLSLEAHEFSVEFMCNNQQFPQGIVLADQSLTKEIQAGNNVLNFLAGKYSYPDMDKDGFNNLAEINANTDPNNPKSQPILGVNVKVNDIITSSKHSSPLLAYNDVGDGLAVWEVDSGTGRKILYSLYSFATNQWSAEALLSAQAGSSSPMAPQVTTAGSEFAVIWRQFNDDNSLFSINSKFYTNGSWQTVQTVASYEGRSFGSAQINSDGSGYVVVWRQADTQKITRLHAKIYDPLVGTNWSGAYTLSDPLVTGSVGGFSLASNGNGYAATWEQNNGSNSEAYANIYSNGSWLPVAKLLNSLSVVGYKKPELASNGTGYQFIWFQFDGTVYQVNTRGFVKATGWSAETSIKSNTDQVFFGLAIASNGTNYGVTWTQQTTGVFSSTGIGASWGVEQRLDITTLLNAWQPDIASNKRGYMVSWSQNTSTGERNIYAAHNLDGGSIWKNAQLLDAEPGNAAAPIITSSGNRYGLVWGQSDPSGNINNVWASIFSDNWLVATNIESAASSARSGSVFPANGGFAFSWREDTNTQSSIVATRLYSSNFEEINYLIKNTHNGSVRDYKIVAADSDRVLAVWRQFHNGLNGLYARVYENGAWGNSLQLSNNTFFQFYVVSDGAGFLVSWAEKDKNSETVYAKLYINGQWQVAETFSVQNEYWDMRVSSNGSGYALVWVDGRSFIAATYNGAVWNSGGNLGGFSTGEFDLTSNGDGYSYTWERGNIYTSTFTNAKGWVISEPVQKSNLSPGRLPIIAANPKNYMVAYLQVDNGADKLHAALYNGDAWGAWKNIDLASLTSAPTGYRLAAASTGFATVWQQSDLNETNIYANVFSGSSWLSVPVQLDVLAGQTGLPAMSSDGNGYMAVWRQQDGAQNEPFNIYANYYNGTAWQASPVLIKQGLENVMTDPQIAAQGNRFATIWLQNQADINDVNISLYNNGIWINPFVIDSTQGLVFDPRIFNNQNTFSAAWKQIDAGGDPIAVELFSRLHF